jgi:type IV pilus assembly protein PilV
MEALIAILVFSVGILGLVGILGTSVRATNDARYRSEAANLANAMVAEMWTMSATQMSVEFSSDGTKLEAYKTEAANLLPNAKATVDLGQPGLSSQSRTVVVTISWKLPGSSEEHRYVTSAQIGKNG